MFRCDEIQKNNKRSFQYSVPVLRATRWFNAIFTLRRLLRPSRMALAMRNPSELFTTRFSENSAMLNSLEFISVTASCNGFILLFGILFRLQYGLSSESTVELNYSGRPKQALGSAHAKLDVSNGPNCRSVNKHEPNRNVQRVGPSENTTISQSGARWSRFLTVNHSHKLRSDRYQTGLKEYNHFM